MEAKAPNSFEVRQSKAKPLMLEHLRKTPIVQVACERVGVARATYYRWLKEDRKFKKDAEQALSAGELLINDMSEGQLILLIKDKNFPAVRYWLDRHHPRYQVERGKQLTKKKATGKVYFKIVNY